MSGKRSQTLQSQTLFVNSKAKECALSFDLFLIILKENSGNVFFINKLHSLPNN